MIASLSSVEDDLHSTGIGCQLDLDSLACNLDGRRRRDGKHNTFRCSAIEQSRGNRKANLYLLLWQVGCSVMGWNGSVMNDSLLGSVRGFLLQNYHDSRVLNTSVAAWTCCLQGVSFDHDCSCLNVSDDPYVMRHGHLEDIAGNAVVRRMASSSHCMDAMQAPCQREDAYPWHDYHMHANAQKTACPCCWRKNLWGIRRHLHKMWVVAHRILHHLLRMRIDDPGCRNCERVHAG
mmetsp:Transcript_41723/g.61077  ORF Transcript_41723/g.61077 Transcript_41723/m.61077 type:complete len:234 (+) Transcript_41723:567-1268(+)